MLEGNKRTTGLKANHPPDTEDTLVRGSCDQLSKNRKGKKTVGRRGSKGMTQALGGAMERTENVYSIR